MPVVPGISLASNRPVHQMRHIHHRLQRDLGAVKSAAASSSAGRELLAATLFAILVAFALVLVAARLIKHTGDPDLECSGHGRLLKGGLSMLSIFDARPKPGYGRGFCAVLEALLSASWRD